MNWYASETWTLSVSDISRLSIFERKILWKINGLVKEGEIWRIINNKNCIKFINLQILFERLRFPD